MLKDIKGIASSRSGDTKSLFNELLPSVRGKINNISKVPSSMKPDLAGSLSCQLLGERQFNGGLTISEYYKQSSGVT